MIHSTTVRRSNGDSLSITHHRLVNHNFSLCQQYIPHQNISHTNTEPLPSTERPPSGEYLRLVKGPSPKNPTAMASRSQPRPIQSMQDTHRSFEHQLHCHNSIKLSRCVRFTDLSESALYSDGPARASLQLIDNVVGRTSRPV